MMVVYYCKKLKFIEKRKMSSVPGIRALHAYEVRAATAEEIEKVGDSFFGDIVIIEEPIENDNQRRTER